MSTKVHITSYVKGPEPFRPLKVAFGSAQWTEIIRHFRALMSPRVQMRTCRRWVVVEALALTSVVATAILFLTGAETKPIYLLLPVDVALLVSVAAALFSRAWMNYRQQQVLVEKQFSSLAFRLANREYCRLLKEPGGLVVNDPLDKSNHLRLEAVMPYALEPGDVILVEAGQLIYANGVIHYGAAVIDESAVTGRSMYVLREAGGDCEVMHDTLVVAGRILVEVTPRLGHPLDWISGARADARINVPALKSPFERI